VEIQALAWIPVDRESIKDGFYPVEKPPINRRSSSASFASFGRKLALAFKTLVLAVLPQFASLPSLRLEYIWRMTTHIIQYHYNIADIIIIRPNTIFFYMTHFLRKVLICFKTSLWPQIGRHVFKVLRAENHHLKINNIKYVVGLIPYHTSVPVAKWITRPPSKRKIVGSTPTRDKKLVLLVFYSYQL
jgi:hypothetical protein